ncbi:MAG: histidine phosphatase family protein [Opitutaceae bacterium]|nr:histidine phosphatase family protein [Opitutaceae bacterium]
MNAVLIRHTRIKAPLGLCYGRSDVPLAATFPEEAAAVQARLPWMPATVWTSPAKRCRLLAERLGAGAVKVDSRLAELDFGLWEGRRWDELHGSEVETWMRAPWTARPPGGETAGELLRRVDAFRKQLLMLEAGRTAVVTHAGVIRAWRSLAERRSLESVFAEQIEYGAVYEAT